MLTDYLHPLLPPFLSECSCFDIYNVCSIKLMDGLGGLYL